MHEYRAAIQAEEMGMLRAKIAAQLRALRARGRRVLEDARAKKRRRHPLRSQRRNCCKLISRDRRADLGNIGNVIVAARGNQCDRAGVLAPRGIWVNAGMQRR